MLLLGPKLSHFHYSLSSAPAQAPVPGAVKVEFIELGYLEDRRILEIGKQQSDSNMYGSSEKATAAS